MGMTFQPDVQQHEKIHVPFFEDADAASAPGYATSKAIDRLQSEIAVMIERLGGTFPLFRQGAYESGGVKRYGFEVHFAVNGHPALMQVAGLPMRTETEKKRQQVLRQALYAVNESLRAAFMQQVFSPGFAPLLQFMLVDGNKTVGEALMERNAVPILNPRLSSGVIVTRDDKTS